MESALPNSWSQSLKSGPSVIAASFLRVSNSDFSSHKSSDSDYYDNPVSLGDGDFSELQTGLRHVYVMILLVLLG